MKACSTCGCYCRAADASCPHCGVGFGGGLPARTSAALLLGLTVGALNGCVSGSKYGVADSGFMAAEYGVPDSGLLDSDEDGWTRADGDCDDTDATIHPEATETPDDGVDSNCDGEDNT